MFPRLIIRLAVLALGLLAVCVAPSSAAPYPPTTHSLPTTHLVSSVSRSWAPVVLTAAQLPALDGAPLDRLAVWVYRAGAWQTVPWQVDEKDASGYTAQGDGVLNGGDEVVVMLEDLGDTAPSRLPDADIVHLVSVADPSAPTEPARVAYVARMTTPTVPPTVDYVQYDPATRRVSSARYAVGLHPQRPVLDYLALNGSGVNLLDRSKLRLVLYECLFGCTVINEDELPVPPLTPVKDGPLRVVLSQAGSLAYRDWLWLATDVDLSLAPSRVVQVQLRLDLATTVQGARYCDANRPDGVTVDGEPDDVPSLPPSPWHQIDHATGRLVSQYRVHTPYVTLYTFYQERTTTVNTDTGDHLAWGDHGIAIDEPVGERVQADQALWALPPDAALDGATLARQAATPLVVAVSHPQFPTLYLPLLQRGE